MNFFSELKKRSKSLFWAGWLNLVAFVVLLALSFYDDRLVSGANVWHKPMKFAISICIFLWTMGWYLAYLPQIRKVQKIKLIIILAMLLEQVIIIVQAARGELSHFNISSIGNAFLFQLMGIAIVVNTVMVCWALLLLRPVETLALSYKRGLQIGMFIFILASLEGFLMVGNLGHTIGAPDGQEGIFFLNWAKAYGDLRIAHFFGLHAMQAVPLFAWYVAREKVTWVYAFGLVYIVFSSLTLWNALAGNGIWFLGK
jgi:hypothetical protein